MFFAYSNKYIFITTIYIPMEEYASNKADGKYRKCRGICNG